MQRRPNNTFISFLIIMLLLAVVNTASAQQQKYYAYFGSDKEHRNTECTVFAGQQKFTRPTLNVSDGSKSIRSRFSYRWYIKGKNKASDLTIIKDKRATVDDVTGSSVQLLYGVVAIGYQTGEFDVVAELIPVDASKYASDTVSYHVKVVSPEITFSAYNGTEQLTDGTSTLYINTYKKGSNWESANVALPTVRLYNSSEEADVTDRFDISYSFANGDKFAVDDKNKTFSSNAGSAEADGTLTITAKAKTNYYNADDDVTLDMTKTYGSEPKTITVKVKSNPMQSNLIGTKISFTNKVEEHYRYYRYKNEEGEWQWMNEDHPVQMPVIKDNYGNDVTYAFDFTLGYYDNGEFKPSYQIPGQSVFYKYSDNPLDDYPKDQPWSGWHYSAAPNTAQLTVYNMANGFNNSSARTPDDYIVALRPSLKNEYKNIYSMPANLETTETVEGMLYGSEKTSSLHQNVYNLRGDEYVYRNYKHAPSLVFDPDPTSNDVKMARELSMSPTSRFIIEGAIKYGITGGKIADSRTLNGTEVPADSLLYGNGRDGYEGFSYSFFVPDKMNFDKQGADTVKIKNHEASFANKTYVKVEKGWAGDPLVCNQSIYKIGDNGKQLIGSDGKPETEVVQGTLYFSKRDWGNDDVSVKFYGTGYIPMFYTVIPWNNHYDIGSSQLAVVHVVETEPTQLVIDPTTIYTNVNVMSVPPTVKVIDGFKKDISDLFTITPAKGTSTDASGNDAKWRHELTTEGINKYRVTPKVAGTFNINVTALLTNDNAQYSNPNPGTEENPGKYTVIASNTDEGTGLYEIVYDAKEFSSDNFDLDDKYNSDTKKFESTGTDMGKLHFIKDGSLKPGLESYQEVPGLNITFGRPIKEGEDDDDYQVKTIGDRHYLEIGAFQNDNDGNPDQGYIKIDALTNGYLTIDARFTKITRQGTSMPQKYLLHNMTTEDPENQDISFADDYDGKAKFALPLLAGNTYALYTNGVMDLNGINFDPAFISLPTDHEGWHSAVAFPNGYTGSLPRLRSRTATNTVSYYVLDAKQSGSTTIEKCKDNEGYHVAIDEKTGSVGAKKNTGDGTLTGKDKNQTTANVEMSNRITIVGSVLGQQKTVDGKTVQVEKRPHYNLFIGDMPTYIVPEGAVYDPGNRFSTTNIPTRIWMTIGGWENTNQTEFPYYNNKNVALSDGWKTAKMDSTGRDNMTVDNFNYQVTGVQNPADEDVASWSGTKIVKQRGDNFVPTEYNSNGSFTFNVPVRGSYLKFEPEESGRLFVYVLQNGMTDIAKTDGKKHVSKDYYLRHRAMYIVDETGNNVPIPEGSDGWTGLDKYISESNDNFPNYTAQNKNYFTSGMLRCAWNQGEGLKFDEDETHSNSWKGNYENKGKDSSGKTILTERGQKDYDADKQLINQWWNSGSTVQTGKVDGPLEVLKLSDGGFVLPTKGYVRYTFNVKAGKTYFMFIKGSKLGFCGFGFLPDGYTQGDNATKWMNAAGNNPEEKLNSTLTAFTEDVYQKLPAISDTPVTLKASLQKSKDGSYDSQKSNLKDKSYSDVKLYRTIRNKRWNGICLPFSVSEFQVKQLFGENSSIITFDSVRADRNGVNPETGKAEDHYRTVHFTRHVSQLIEAGRPYYIYPDVENVDAGEPIGTKDGDSYYIDFKNVTFEGKDTMTVINYNDKVADYNNLQTSDDNKIDIFTYKSAGIYDCTRVPYYSYYMKSTKDNSYLARLVPSKPNAKNPLLLGYNTYIYPYSEDAEGKKLIETTQKANAKAAGFWVTGAEVNGGEVTGIDEIVDDININQTNFVDGVYTVDGIKVSDKNSLKGLPAGVYIMKGKKYNVE